MSHGHFRFPRNNSFKGVSLIVEVINWESILHLCSYKEPQADKIGQKPIFLKARFLRVQCRVQAMQLAHFLAILLKSFPGKGIATMRCLLEQCRSKAPFNGLKGVLAGWFPLNLVKMFFFCRFSIFMAKRNGRSKGPQEWQKQGTTSESPSQNV